MWATAYINAERLQICEGIFLRVICIIFTSHNFKSRTSGILEISSSVSFSTSFLHNELPYQKCSEKEGQTK